MVGIEYFDDLRVASVQDDERRGCGNDPGYRCCFASGVAVAVSELEGEGSISGKRKAGISTIIGYRYSGFIEGDGYYHSATGWSEGSIA